MKRPAKIILAFCVVLCLLFTGTLSTLWWFIESGRLKALIETRAADAAGLNVRMKSIGFSWWPLGADVEELVITAPGHEDSPLLTCPSLKITTSVRDLLKGRFVSLKLAGPRITVVSDERDGLNVPKTSPKSEGSSRFSIGTILISQGEIGIDTPTVKASVKGVVATLREPVIPADGTKVFKLRIDSARASIEGETGKSLPIELKSVHSIFRFRPKASGTEIEADINTLITTELPYSTLPPDIPLGVSLAADYVPHNDSLENALLNLEIPLFSTIRLYGSVANLTTGTPTPRCGFTIEVPQMADLLEYNELLQRPTYRDVEMSGSLAIDGEFEGTLTKPKLVLAARAANARLAWKDTVIEGLSAEIPMTIDSEGFGIERGSISSHRAVIPLGEHRIETAPLNALVSLDQSHVTVNTLTTRWENLGELSASGSYELDSGLFRANARLGNTAIADALTLVSSKFYGLPDSVTAGGTLELELDLDGKLASTLENLNVKYDVSIQGGEVSSGEFLTAAGIDASLSGHVESDSTREPWRFSVGGEVGGFEVLIHTFYKSFEETSFPFTLSGEYVAGAKRFQNAAASLVFGPMGELTAAGTIQLAPEPEITTEITIERIDLASTFEEVGRQLLAEMLGSSHVTAVGGIASGSLAIQVRDNRRESSGTLRLSDGRLELDSGALSADSVSVILPFSVYFPQAERTEPLNFTDTDFGSIALGGLTIGPVNIPSLDLDVALKENTLRIKDPPSIGLFGGALDIGQVHGENLFGASAKLTTSLSARDLSLTRISEALGLAETTGTLNAHFPEIAFTSDSLTTRGSASLNAFEGAIDINSVAVEQPLSPVRTFKADLDFKEISLFSLTEILNFGAIRGIMEGRLKGLEVSQGQPAAFEADFETVSRRGVRQRITFDAVQNITILGTGRGFQAGVGRGFASFFDEFGYSKIGFYCTLKNDNFRMRGKVVRDGTEYFVKGITLGPSINVINRNPGQTVSFKSMIERINRIKRKQQEDKK